MTTHTTSTAPGAAPVAVATTAAWRWANLSALTALTAYSTGIGWQAQFVSYPLFGHVAADDFPAYHLDYNSAIPLVVIVPGFLTFVGCAILPFTRPPELPRAGALVVAASGLVALVSTVAWAIPMHDKLDRIGQDAVTIDSLLGANAVRTAALTVGAAALTWSLTRLARRAASKG